MLNIFNTLTNRFEVFKPFEDSKVKMYSCGPSVYQPPHIGNYRTFLFEDVVQRYLEYLGYRVTRLMTLTDVEEKALVEAKKSNVALGHLTRQNEVLLFRDFEFLKIKIPDQAVRASTVIDQAAMLTESLVAKGYAYWHEHEGEKNAYFDPLRFKGFGKLAKLDMSRWPRKRRRFHKDTYPGTPWNRGDFILWQGCKKGEACWETAVGRGRPAWNIQDAAIVTKHLGFSVDVAAGGVDNLVRHHDYTLAVAEAVSGKQFAKYWLHGAHLLVDGKKMSKSRGNVYYPKDLAAKGYGGAHVRFFLIYGHYRKSKNFTFEELAETSKKLELLRKRVRGLVGAKSGGPSGKEKDVAQSILTGFEANMNRDLDVKGAFDHVFEEVSSLDKLKQEGKITPEDAAGAVTALEQVDRVLRVVF